MDCHSPKGLRNDNEKSMDASKIKNFLTMTIREEMDYHVATAPRNDEKSCHCERTTVLAKQSRIKKYFLK